MTGKCIHPSFCEHPKFGGPALQCFPAHYPAHIACLSRRKNPKRKIRQRSPNAHFNTYY